MSPVGLSPHRSTEEATLLNPAFLATVIHRAVGGFQREAGRGMPYVLVFLVPPLVLVQTARVALPARRDSSLAAWIHEHPEIRLRFAENAAALVPVVRDGLLFGTSNSVLTIEEDRIGSIPLPRGAATQMGRNTKDFQDVLNGANFVGRWYAYAGTPQTIMTLWGVRP